MHKQESFQDMFNDAPYRPKRLISTTRLVVLLLTATAFGFLLGRI